MSDFPSSPSNPFQSPTAESNGSEEVAPGERGPMPTSVVVALVTTGIFVLLSGIGALGNMAAGQSPIGGLVSFAIGLLILLGLAKGHRLAYQWGRILVCIAAVLYTIGVVFGGFGIVMLLSNPEMMGAGGPLQGEDASMMRTAMLIGIGVLVILVAALWTIFFSLGTMSARKYFRVICPNCGSRKVKAVDFFYNKGKCKRCSAVW